MSDVGPAWRERLRDTDESSVDVRASGNGSQPGSRDAPRVTLADIADKAGVSPATVSKVLNGRTDVAASTRGRVQRLLSEAGYSRRGARTAKRHTRLVELITTGFGTPWAGELLEGVEDEARRLGAGLVITATHSRHPSPGEWISGITARRPEGVVVVASELSDVAARELASRGIRVVLVDPLGNADTSVPIVGGENWAGGMAATQHLVDLGHRRVGVITGPDELVCSRERLDGYRAALSRSGIEIDNALIRHGDFRPEGGRDAARELLSLDDPPTGIFAGSDLQAMGVYAEAASRNLRIPMDLSVVGFDNIPLSEWLTPQLTTVHYPIAEMGRMATRMALEQSTEPEEGQVPRIQLTTTFVPRASTAAPRGSKRS